MQGWVRYDWLAGSPCKLTVIEVEDNVVQALGGEIAPLI